MEENEVKPEDKVDPILQIEPETPLETKPQPELESIPVIPLFNKIFPKGRKTKLLRNFMITAIVASFIAMVVMFFVYRIDGLFLPSTLNGVVLDHNNEPLQGVVIYMEGREIIKTDQTGKFKINKGYGEYDFKFVVDKFETLEQKIAINRGNNDIEVRLKPNAIGDILIKFVTADNVAISTDNMEIYFDEKPYQLNTKAQLLIVKYPVGSYKFSLKSPVYFDVESSIDLKAGHNESELQLTDAWNLNVNVKDWLDTSALEKATVTCEGVDALTDKNGLAHFTDIINFNNVKIKIVKDGYLPLEQSILDNAGLTLPDEALQVELVKVGRVAYISSRTGSKNLYSSNYDGTQEVMLSDNKGDVMNYQYSTDGKTVYFLSTRDKVKDAIGNIIYLPYSVPLAGGSIQKIAKTTYSDHASIGTYNYKAMKRAFVNYVYDETEQPTSSVFFGNIDGSTSTLLLEKKALINQLLISNDGGLILFSVFDVTKPNENGIFSLNTKSKTVKLIANLELTISRIIQLSPDGNNLLLSLYDPAKEGTDDLWLVNFNGKAKRITDNSTQELNAQFINNNNVVYISERDQTQNIYLKNIDNLSENALTSNEKVGHFEINNSGDIEYYNNGTLSMLNIDIPGKSVEITTNVMVNWIGEF